MTSNWHALLASSPAVFDGETAEVLHFGDPAGELLAASQSAIVAPLSHLALIDVEGEDARSFLHSQLTSDVNHLTEGQAQHAAWCTAKGRMQASFLVWRQGEHYRLLLSADLLDAVAKRLQMFILRAKVKLTVQRDVCLFGLGGTQVAGGLTVRALACPEKALETAVSDACEIVRLDEQRCIVAASVPTAAELWQELAAQARPVGRPVWQWLDIRFAFPLITLATREEFVPQMADFEKMGGVSFHKGCYPGQEVVARTQYLGKVKRHLFRLSSDSAMRAGDDLYSPGNPDQAAGKVMTAAPSPTGGFAALAVVQSNHADDLHLIARDGPRVEAMPVNPD